MFYSVWVKTKTRRLVESDHVGISNGRLQIR